MIGVDNVNSLLSAVVQLCLIIGFLYYMLYNALSRKFVTKEEFTQAFEKLEISNRDQSRTLNEINVKQGVTLGEMTQVNRMIDNISQRLNHEKIH